MRSGRYWNLIIIFSLFFPYFLMFSGEPALANNAVDPAVQEFIRLVNGKRSRIGCPELKWDDRAAAVARDHSRDMARREYFSHRDPEGKNAFDRLRDSHIRYSVAAENIAMGVHSGREAYDLWLNSPAHRQNMLDCRLTYQGVGKVGDRWTQILLRP